MTIRLFSEQNFYHRQNKAKTTLIRINPHDQDSSLVLRNSPQTVIINKQNEPKLSDIDEMSVLIELEMGAKEAFSQLHKAML